MKQTRSLILFVTLFFFAACSEIGDLTGNEERETGQLKLSLKPALENTEFIDDDFPDRMEESQSAIATITNAKGDTVLNREEFHFGQIDDEYISENIQLEAGQYTVHEFMVAGQDGNHQFFTPVKEQLDAFTRVWESLYYKKVNSPLPVSFEVNGNETHKLAMEVYPAPVNFPYDHQMKVADVGGFDPKDYNCSILEQFNNIDDLIKGVKQEIDTMISQAACGNIENCRSILVGGGDECGPIYAYCPDDLNVNLLMQKFCELHKLRDKRHEMEGGGQCNIRFPQVAVLKDGKCMVCYTEDEICFSIDPWN